MKKAPSLILPKTLFTLLSLSLLILVVACGDDPFLGGERSTLPSATNCTQCNPGEECFELESGESSCLFPDCQNDTTVCAIGFSCNASSDRCEKIECPGGCDAGTHCVFGTCIADYTSENVCSPLFNCREACQDTDELQACISVCQRDVSATCSTCLNERSTCERRDSCNANATNCCVDEYCDCFPNNPDCLDPGAPDCETCAETCRGASNPDRCLSNCAEQVIPCSTCLEPFTACSDGVPSAQVEVECRDEFCDCIICDSTTDVDFSLYNFSLYR